MKMRPDDYARALLAATANATKEQVRERTDAFVALLARRGERTLLKKVLARMERLEEEQGSLTVQVTAEKPLDAADKKTIALAIGIDPGAVRFDARVDAAVGPGARITVGDRVVDATTSARLRALAASLGG